MLVEAIFKNDANQDGLLTFAEFSLPVVGTEELEAHVHSDEL
jgi:hypothetical protein